MTPALELDHITKSYGGVRVVDDLSLWVDPGEIFGMLGPNGSGKTTTIRIALDIVRAETGTARLFGEPPGDETLRRVGYLPEERGLYRQAVLLDLLTYLGRLKKMSKGRARSRAEEMLKRVDLFEHRDKKVQALSRGMNQLAQFSAALIHEPDLLILDEPFSGLDPINVQTMKDIVVELSQGGTAVIFSTHHMPDVEELCERVLLINEGSALVQGPIRQLKEERGVDAVVIAAPRHPGHVRGASSSRAEGDAVEYQLEAGADQHDPLRSYLEAGIQVERFELRRPSLNEIFVQEVTAARRGRRDGHGETSSQVPVGTSHG